MTTSKMPVLFVGAGPGDPELITVKGRRALAQADLIVCAGSLVPKALLKWADPQARTVNSAGLTLADIIDTIADAWGGGKCVVRLHTGDPSLYGAIYEQMAELNQRSIPYRVIPGVTAAFAAAAAMGIEYTLPDISQTLILTRLAGRTPVPEKEALASLAAHQATMAIYSRSLRRKSALCCCLPRQPARGKNHPYHPRGHRRRAQTPENRSSGGHYRGAGAGGRPGTIPATLPPVRCGLQPRLSKCASIILKPINCLSGSGQSAPLERRGYPHHCHRFPPPLPFGPSLQAAWIWAVGSINA